MSDTAQGAGLIGELALYLRDRKPRDVRGSGFGPVLEVLQSATKPVALVGQAGSGRSTVLAQVREAGGSTADTDADWVGGVDAMDEWARRSAESGSVPVVAACDRATARELAARGWEVRVLEPVALDADGQPVPAGDDRTRYRVPAWEASWAVALGTGDLASVYARVAARLGRTDVARRCFRAWLASDATPEETEDNDALAAATAARPDVLPIGAPDAGPLLGRTPVTVAQYAPFADSGKVRAPLEWERQRAHPGRPVYGVSWWEAEAYARWLGAVVGRECRLQSLASAVAAGGDGAFPWGDAEPTADHLNFAQHVGRVTDVDAHPAGAGPLGHLDLSGNVWEWCADGDDGGRVVRGGGWFTNAAYVRNDYSFRFSPDNRFHDLGFRIEVDGWRGHATS